MKKIVGIATMALALASAGFAQEEGLKIGGRLQTGVDANITSLEMDMVNSSIGTNRLRLDVAYTQANWGFDSQFRFQAKKAVAWSNANWKLRHAYGWVNLLNDMLRLEIGKVESSPWATDYQSFGYNLSNQMNIQITPMEGLTFGITANLMNPYDTSYADLDGTYFYRGLNYGVKYSTDMFFALVGYGEDHVNADSDSNDLASDRLWAEFSITPMEMLTASVEGAVKNLTEVDGDRAFNVTAAVDVKPIEALDIFVLGAYDRTSNNAIDALLSVDYKLTDAINGLLHFGYSFSDENGTSNNFFVKPGVGAKLADGVTMQGFYTYSSAASVAKAYNNEGYANKGHSIQLDFVWKF